MEELKPMTAAEFFNVSTCLVLPERSAGCVAAKAIANDEGQVIVREGERITLEQQGAILAALQAGRLHGLDKGYITAVLEMGPCSCCNG